MKSSIHLIALMCLTAWSGHAQQSQTDFVVIDQTAENKAALMAEKSDGRELYVNESPKPATYVIAAMIEGKDVQDLHLYVHTRPGALVFGSGILNMSTIDEHKVFLQTWKQSVKGRVIIHDASVFEEETGLAFRQALERITGLVFEVR